MNTQNEKTIMERIQEIKKMQEEHEQQRKELDEKLEHFGENLGKAMRLLAEGKREEAYEILDNIC